MNGLIQAGSVERGLPANWVCCFDMHGNGGFVGVEPNHGARAMGAGQMR